MTLIDFAQKMTELGLGADEIRVIKDDDFVFKGRFMDIPEWLTNLHAKNVVVAGVSMILSSVGKSPEYITMVSI